MKDILNGKVLKFVLAGLTYVLFSIMAVSIFALIIGGGLTSDTAIKIITQVIKLICLFAVCFIFTGKEKGLINGAILGAVSGTLLYLVFSVFGIISFSFWRFILEIIFTAVSGGIICIITVNIKSK